MRARTLAELRAADAGRWFTADGGRTMPYAERGTVVSQNERQVRKKGQRGLESLKQ